jgi:hypothetical protein
MTEADNDANNDNNDNGMNNMPTVRSSSSSSSSSSPSRTTNNNTSLTNNNYFSSPMLRRQRPPQQQGSSSGRSPLMEQPQGSSPGGYDILRALWSANSAYHGDAANNEGSHPQLLEDNAATTRRRRRRRMDNDVSNKNYNERKGKEEDDEEEWWYDDNHAIVTFLNHHNDNYCNNDNNVGDHDNNNYETTTKQDVMEVNAITKIDLSNAFLDVTETTTTNAKTTDDENNVKKEEGNNDNHHHRHQQQQQQQQQQFSSPPTIPPPEAKILGIMDWSLKRRIRIECIPGRCLPSHHLNYDEGLIHSLALEYLSSSSSGSSRYNKPSIWKFDVNNNNNEDGMVKKVRQSSREIEIAARWLASTMYYQHPAIHPLPPSMLSSSSVTTTTSPPTAVGSTMLEKKRKHRQPMKKKEKSKEENGMMNSTNSNSYYSSYIHGPYSLNQRVRLSGAGCMGGLGTSTTSYDNTTANSLTISSSTTSSAAAHMTSTISSLLIQRRRDWQVAFRSVYHTWKLQMNDINVKLCQYQHQHQQQQKNNVTTMNDEISRCSFYIISSCQIILFRGGCVKRSSSSSSTDDEKDCTVVVPMIIFSSTTLSLRSKLNSLGVTLRLFTPKKNKQQQQVNNDGGNNNHHVFSESLFNIDDISENISSENGGGGGDMESVHAELIAIKRADDEKGKVTVEVKTRKKKKRQQKYNKSSSSSDVYNGGDGDSGNHPDLQSPLFVYGIDDCAAVYELLLNTYGLSSIVHLERQMGGRKTGMMSIDNTTTNSGDVVDVPLLLYRSLGSCLLFTLRTLSISSRRDCANMNQVGQQNTTSGRTNAQKQQRPTSFASKATIELRGPVLPCALRDMTCAMINLMLLDKYAQRDEDESSTTACDDNSSNNNAATSTHQFVMFLQSHNGECSVTTPKSTGSSSSLGFNGSQIPLLPDEVLGGDNDSPVTELWRECELGHRVNMLAWDISCSELVPYQ